MSTWIMCIIARNSALNLWRIIILRKTSLWTHWSVPNVRTRSWLYTIICRNVSVPESFPRIRILRISRQIFVWSLLEMFSNGAWKRGTQILREIWNVPWNLIWMESSNNWCCTKNTNVSKAFFRATSFFIIMDSTVRMNLLNTNILLRTNILLKINILLQWTLFADIKRTFKWAFLKVLSILEGKWHFLMPTIISLCLYYSPGCKKNPIAYYYIAGNL